MADKQLTSDALASNIAGLSKSQLYDIMSQMKNLIEQNQDQARQILMQNPLLTRALFQAQIMLGMVKPSPAIPSIPPQASQQASAMTQHDSTYASQQLPAQAGQKEQTNIARVPSPVRKPQQNQPPLSMLSSAPPGLHSQSQYTPLQSGQPRSQLNPQSSSMPHSQPSQVPNINIPPTIPQHSGSQPMPPHQPSMPHHSSQLQQPMQMSGVSHLPLQPPLPPQPRPPMAHQFQSHMGSNMSFQAPGPPQLHHSQQQFHSGMKPQMGISPSFIHGQQPISSQQPQSLYPGGPPQGGNSMQIERGSQWGLPEKVGGSQLPGLQPPQQQLPHSQPGLGNQPRPASIPPDMEQVLLQQVMSLTPEQINSLPPEQKHQVLQLQQMLRQ